MRYIRQLDSIRAIAVILVIISHWIRKDHFVNFTPNGLIGVDLFFILSGFLITSILLTNRLKVGPVYSEKFRLIPGMTLEADLKVGTRSPAMYVLGGALRGVGEAMREP